MRHRFVGLLLLAAACSEATTPSAPPVVGISPTVQWSGGEVELTSAAFASVLPVLVSGAETLAVRRIATSTVGASLPLGPSGTVTIELLQGGRRFQLDPVQRVGFKEVQLLRVVWVGPTSPPSVVWTFDLLS
jgi:hypothetical protein